jgi:hypothetical protein
MGTIRLVNRNNGTIDLAVDTIRRKHSECFDHRNDLTEKRAS